MNQEPRASQGNLRRTAGRQLIYLGLASLIGFGTLMWSLASLSEGVAGSALDAIAGSVTLALSEEPPQLDSSRATDTVSGQILGHVMEGLLRYDEFNRIVPGVAERWEIGATKATFWLRDDAFWSDGSRITAHDFVFAWQTALDPQTASEYAFILYPIKNAEAINNGQLDTAALGVTALNDKTLLVRLERPVAYFNSLLVFPTYFPIKQSFYEKRQGRYGADASELLYNGPFVIEKWVHGSQLRMVRNPHYWDRNRIRLNVIDYAYITSDVNATLNLFKDGKIAIAGLNSENLDDALQRRWKLERFNEGCVGYISFNHRSGRLTRNRHLRKAMQLAMDTNELVYKVVAMPGNLPGVSFFPVWLQGVESQFRQEFPAPETQVDITQARFYLAQAKKELGLDEWRPLTFLTGDRATTNKISEYLQQEFKEKLGLDIAIDRQIFKQRLAKMSSGDFDMVLAGWCPDYADPLTFGDLFASWNKNNRGEYKNPKLDQWVRIAQNSLEPHTRMNAFSKIQKIIHLEAVILPTYETGSVYVRDPRLKGVVKRAVGMDSDYSNAYIDG
ncbi:MAG: peptide ABC transporter substrate-binding protein [Pseudomonadales bacterium]|nr:peptide ABC transporter substrate-binding protein [Pseudomonadales bacterium]